MMTRADAYSVLSRELQSWRQRPYDELAATVGQPASERIVRLGDEDVIVRVQIRWVNARKGTLRIEAVAEGPSCWRLERLEEAVVVGPSHLP